MYLPILLACLITMMMWIPYLQLTVILSGDPKSDNRTTPAWAKRLQQAHYNAVENLPIFIGICLVAEFTQSSTPLMIAAAMMYCIVRVAHYVFYALGIPFLRTIAFMIGWLSTLYIGAMTFINIA